MSYSGLTIPILLDAPIGSDGAIRTRTQTQTRDSFLAELTGVDFERVDITTAEPVPQIDLPSTGKVKELVNKRVLIRPLKQRNSHLHLKRGVVRGLFGDKNDPNYVHVYIDGLTHMVTKDEVQVLEA